MSAAGAVGSAPLAGITVIDFSELLPGPFFTQNLCELGARVIKIERPPYGDNVRRMGPGVFDAVNRGKHSLMVDLKDESKRAEVHALIASADVLVESYRPGVMARLEMDYASLKEACPRLVYVSLSGYGQSGPWAQLPGHDINYLAAAGVLAISGDPGGAPAQSFGLPIADLCGAMYALSSTMAALFQRHTTGAGQYLDVALADCALHWMNPRIGAFREAGATHLNDQREASLVKPAYGAFCCSDGHYVSIAALEDQFWSRLCQAVDLKPFDGEAYRTIKSRKAAASAINARLAEVIAAFESTHVFELLRRHDVPVAPMIEPSQVASLPQFAERSKFEQGESLPVARYPVPMTGVIAGGLGNAPILDSFRS
jgi:CoA:oxalate CoA-transferase